MFVLGFATSAFAITAEIPSDTQAVVAKGTTQITLGGRILVRGWYLNDLAASLPTAAESAALYTTNAYIIIDAKVAEGLRGFMEIETAINENPNTGLYIWGSPSGYDVKPLSDLMFRQLWLEYSGQGLLGVPAGIKVGHQLLTLGEKQFLRHERFGDDAVLVFVQPTKELLIAALTAKLVEGEWTKHKDDIDANVALMTYKVDKDNTVGLNLTWIKSDGNTPSVGPVVGLDFYNLGLHANGKVQGLSYAAELDMQFGDVDVTSTVEREFRGVGLFAKLGYKVDPVNIRASFATGSGDSNSTDNKNKEFQTTVGMDAQSLLARFPNYTQIYERATRSAASPIGVSAGSQGQLLTGNTRTTGIANTTYYNLGIDVVPTKDLNLSLDGYLLRATKAWQAGQSKKVGSEVDLGLTYKITKNLSYLVTAGFFTPGKYYTTGTSPLVTTEKKTVTLFVHGLDLRF